MDFPNSYVADNHCTECVSLFRKRVIALNNSNPGTIAHNFCHDNLAHDFVLQNSDYQSLESNISESAASLWVRSTSDNNYIKNNYFGGTVADDSETSRFFGNEGYFGIGDNRIFKATVTWDGGSPQTVCTVADGYAVTAVWVEVTTTWDGAGATVDIGDGGVNNDFIPTATINLAVVGFYGYEADTRGSYLWDAVNGHERDYIYTAGDTIDAFVAAGGGATQGEVLVTVQITRVGG